MGKARENTRKLKRKEAIEISDKIFNALIPYCEYVFIAGSLRRKKTKVNDLDFVLEPKTTLDPVKDAIKNLPDFKTLISNGDRRMSVIAFNDVQIDFLFSRHVTELPAMLLHFTGSKWNNIKLSKRAEELGYKLNMYGLWVGITGTRVPVRSEQNIYEILKLPYKEPFERK